MADKIKCCRYCIAPKRHVGCHGECVEYLEERKALDELSQGAYEKRRIAQNIYEQRSESVRKAAKRKRR